jgi:hypothetical protein
MVDTGASHEEERHLVQAVLALARTLRDERDRLADRLRKVEHELSALASRLDIDDTEPPDSPTTPR